jgi:hypothetical protein
MVAMWSLEMLSIIDTKTGWMWSLEMLSMTDTKTDDTCMSMCMDLYICISVCMFLCMYVTVCGLWYLVGISLLSRHHACVSAAGQVLGHTHTRLISVRLPMWCIYSRFLLNSFSLRVLSFCSLVRSVQDRGVCQ